ncbi:hypothetical protein C900_04149 [Fulvivirga imtechensis AK7]|uniref:histidine kinase n=1 Tax=Fulvivirga imtechensis AK7 TaxID=1237149 RepID=L8K1H6_9BACT|nr:two-component regulator propeller domain-containing protein [Fulvivirga imtechensis]ELR73297.1 hypothetical protein C900_04149 [Fulvivirga imtechensis AK7]
MKFLQIQLIFFVAILIAGIANDIFGQPKRLVIPGGDTQQYYVERWTTDDGLPANTLLRIHKSEKGYIWLSSFDGVIKFDGIQFTNYTRANDNIPSNAISQIEEDSNNKLWISTYGDGIMSYQNGEFISENDENMKNQSIQTMVIDNDRIWIGTRGNGLYYHTGKEINKFKHHPAIENITISAISIVADGTIWIGTEGNGLVSYHNEQFQIFTTKDGLPGNKIFSIHIDQNGKLWVGTDLGLCWFNGKNFEPVAGIDPCLINTIFEDKKGNLWLATDCGLYRKTRDANKWAQLALADVIPSDFFTDVLVDDNENIWVTTYHAGLAHIKKSKFTNYTVRDGLATKAISSIAAYGDNRFLVGTNNGTINLIEHDRVGEFKLNTPLPDTRIRSILRDSKGNIWIGTSVGMLLKKRSGSEKWYTTENGLPDAEVRLFFEDSNHNIWFGTRAGGLVKVIGENKFEIYDKSNLLNSDFIMSIQEDRYGNLLVGTNESGLNIIKRDGTVKYITKEDGLASNLIFNTYTDQDGVTWVVTNGGICRMVDGKFFNITAAHGLATDAPFDFLEDAYGDVWLPTSKGVVKAGKKELNDFADGTIDNINFRLFDKQDGLEVAECTGAAKSVIAGDGSIWVPALNGVFMISPQEIGYNEIPPPVFITSLTADGRKMHVKNDTLRLDANVNRIIIDYEALNYISPAKVRYKFMLSNFDKTWIKAGHERSAQYTNLQHGTYTFKVTATNEDGIWNENPASVTIIVSPHFYETPLFYLVTAIVTTLLILAAFRLSVHRVNRRNKTLTSLVEEQTSELMEINRVLEEQKEELLLQHDLLAQKNLELEKAHTEITSVNEKLTKVNSQLEDKVEERTKDLRSTLDKLRSSNEELDTFIYRASHDLKGPTASLLGLTMLGKAISNDHRYLEFFDRIEDTAYNMNGILAKLLSMHVILKTTVSYVPINMELLLSDVKSSLNTSKVRFTLQSEFDTSPTFYSDITLLTIILKNLLENSLIFRNPSKELVIRVGVEKRESMIYLSVEDNGEGIEDSIKDKIFDLFYRGSQKSKGNGLGLYLVKKSVEKLNGKAEISSEPGKYTKINIIFPAKDIS